MIAFSTDTSAALARRLPALLPDRELRRPHRRTTPPPRARNPPAALDPRQRTTAGSPRPSSRRRRPSAAIRVMETEHYTAATRDEAVRKIAVLRRPDRPAVHPRAGRRHAGDVAGRWCRQNVDTKQVQLNRHGPVERTTRVLGLPALQNAWFAAPENGGFNAFATRYRHQIQHRSDADRDAFLRRRLARRRTRAFARPAAVLRQCAAQQIGLQRRRRRVSLPRRRHQRPRPRRVADIPAGKAKTISPAPQHLPAVVDLELSCSTAGPPGDARSPSPAACAWRATPSAIALA